MADLLHHGIIAQFTYCFYRRTAQPLVRTTSAPRRECSLYHGDSRMNFGKISHPCPDRILCARCSMIAVVGMKVLRDHGQSLVRELVKCCTRELPCYSLDGDRGSVSGVLFRMAILCQPWLQVESVYISVESPCLTALDLQGYAP